MNGTQWTQADAGDGTWRAELRHYPTRSMSSTLIHSRTLPNKLAAETFRHAMDLGLNDSQALHVVIETLNEQARDEHQRKAAQS